MLSYKERSLDVDTIYPGPPGPPCKTESVKENKLIDKIYEQEMVNWALGYAEWMSRRKEKIDRNKYNRFEILDIESDNI